MKELSIEEKAKAYDEAVKRVENIKTGKCETTFVFTEGLFEHIFPELKENEDEKIRKKLIAYFKNLSDVYSLEPLEINPKKVIAWLENQGKQKSAVNTKVFIPNFNVGDWIVDAIDTVYQIKEIKEDRYLLQLYNSNDVISSKISTIDNDCHLWTIQDAKDGDALFYDDGWTCIFKNIHGIWYSSYCFITADGEFNKGYERHAIDAKINGHVHPAAKDQRDLLFQKMKEAGYEWDAEKKELKKIEYKPAEWEPQTGDTFRKKGTISPTYHLCDKLEDGITFDFVENREVGIMGGEITIFALKQDYELVERLKPIEDVVEEELNKALQTKVKQKSAWSEEDENTRQWLISEIEKLLAQFIKSTNGNCAYSEYVDCLKELIEQLKQL